METNYTAEQRRAKILALLGESGEVRVNMLSKLFGISEVTVRLDLEELEAKGQLSRVHGGAIGSQCLFYDMDLKERMDTNSEYKRAIAEELAGMISNNDSLMMNSGTTLLYVLRAIKNRRNVRLVTNSIILANEAAHYSGFDTVLLGGTVNYECQFTYGFDTIAQLKKYHSNKLILSVDGINCESGLSLYISGETEVSRQMIEQAGKVIIAADHTKIGRVAFADIAPVSAADCIVTTCEAPAEYLEQIRSLGVAVIESGGNNGKEL